MGKVEMEYGSVLTGATVKATYTPSDDEMYLHNPYIEAFPEIKLEELKEKISRPPSYDQALRQHPAHKRLGYVSRISLFVHPMPAHMIIAQKFINFIKQGYMTRNPSTADWVRQMRSAFPGVSVDESQKGCFLRPTANGMAIIGASGMGKTLTVESVLSLMPQVIVHSEYNGNPFDRKQIVWLKVDAAKDGSAKGLCRIVFYALDRLMGTNYFNQYSRYTARDSLEVLAKLSYVFGLGLLVIDEVQRLNLAASGGAKELINFFSSLQKTLNIPVVLIGTYSGMNLFNDEFACSRTLCSQGDLIWNTFTEDDKSWDYFIEALWKYQFTNIETPLTKMLRKTLYMESQGIIDIAVKLYMLVQMEVIGLEDERITSKLIETVAKRHLNLVRPMLTAIRSRDIERIRQIKDLCSPIDEHALNQEFQRARERLAFYFYQQPELKQDSDHKTRATEIAELLLELDFDKETAWDAANEAIKQSPKNSSSATIKRIAIKLASAMQKTDNFSSKSESGEPGLPTTVMRDCGGNKDESSYDQLKNIGLTIDMRKICGT